MKTHAYTNTDVRGNQVVQPINRRSFLTTLAGGATALACANLSSLAAIAASKMNVLFISVDDLRPQLNCYGQTMMHTPNIDALAADGMLFERAYCQQAVCAPSRASLLSGCRPDTTKVYDLETPLRSVMPDIITLPQHFKNNGYSTISISKVYHHWDDDPQGWTERFSNAQGAWHGSGYLLPESTQPAWENADVEDNEYKDGVYCDYMIQKLQQYKDQPFFMAAGFVRPHLPFLAPKKYADLYPLSSITLPDNMFKPTGVTTYSFNDKQTSAESVNGELRNYSNIPDSGDLDNNLRKQLIRAYYASVSYTDALIGKLIEELKRLNIYDNTLIILWGDHGWKLGEHFAWSKHTNFEVDTNAPLIIRVPGMTTAGQKTKALVEFVDIFPSLAQLCGLSIPEHCEGTSFVPLLSNPSLEWKSAAFSQFPRGTTVMGYSMRTDRYRYIEWQNATTHAVLARELYDHQTDPQENTNIADSASVSALVTQLQAQLAAGWKAAKPIPTSISPQYRQNQSHAPAAVARKQTLFFNLRGQKTASSATTHSMILSKRERKILFRK